MASAVPARNPARAAVYAAALSLCGLGASLAAAGETDAARMTGGWELTAAGANRACRILLRSDASGDERTVGMPAGCRRALPILNAVGGWTAGSEGAVALGDASGAPVLTCGIL